MAAPIYIQRAARLAAQRVEAMLIAMLEAGEFGEVVIVIKSPYELKPLKRVETEEPTVRVRQGHSTLEHER